MVQNFEHVAPWPTSSAEDPEDDSLDKDELSDDEAAADDIEPTRMELETTAELDDDHTLVELSGGDSAEGDELWLTTLSVSVPQHAAVQSFIVPQRVLAAEIFGGKEPQPFHRWKSAHVSVSGREAELLAELVAFSKRQHCMTHSTSDRHRVSQMFCWIFAGAQPCVSRNPVQVVAAKGTTRTEGTRINDGHQFGQPLEDEELTGPVLEDGVADDPDQSMLLEVPDTVDDMLPSVTALDDDALSVWLSCDPELLEERLVSDVERDDDKDSVDDTGRSSLLDDTLLPDGTSSDDKVLAVGSTGDELLEDGSTGDELLEDGSTGDELLEDGSTCDELLEDGSTGDELLEDGSTGDELLEDGSTGVEVLADDTPLEDFSA